VTQGKAPPAPDLDDILKRLESAKAGLVDAIESCPAEAFSKERDGESVKRTLERAVDEINFYYGRLVSQALKLPQPPCMAAADFSSIREALMSLQVAHRRFGNLLHDLIPEDLDRSAEDEHATYTLRQVLEMTIAHYNRRSQQLGGLATKPARKRTRNTPK
jgi:hypothetical protein